MASKKRKFGFSISLERDIELSPLQESGHAPRCRCIPAGYTEDGTIVLVEKPRFRSSPALVFETQRDALEFAAVMHLAPTSVKDAVKVVYEYMCVSNLSFDELLELSRKRKVAIPYRGLLDIAVFFRLHPVLLELFVHDVVPVGVAKELARYAPEEQPYLWEKVKRYKAKRALKELRRMRRELQLQFVENSV